MRTLALAFGLLLGAWAAGAAEYDGLHCWPDSAKTWHDCWWEPIFTPPLEVEVRQVSDLPATAQWLPWPGSGPCQNIVSYRLTGWRGTPPDSVGTARRMMAVRCYGEAISGELIP